MRDIWKPPLEREVRDELDFHLEMRVRELIDHGMTPATARAEAIRRLGDVPAMRARLRQLGEERDRTMHRTEWFAELAQDVRYAWRYLRANPGFSLIALLTLAIGIGATTAIFSAVYSVVLKPLPFPEPDRVMLVGERTEGGYPASVGNYGDVKRENRSFSALGAIFWTNFNLAAEDHPERVLGARVTYDYFTVFGVQPRWGRLFTADEDRPGQPLVVVLSHRLWARRFGSDPKVVGTEIRMNSLPYAVIGVMPAAFDFTVNTEEVWVPAAFTPEQWAEHDSHYLTLYGRLEPGVDQFAARADLGRIMARLKADYPDVNSEISAGVEPMFTQFVGSARERLLVLLGAVGLVLLIGCVNVANLLLARGSNRARELAVRAALGAGRSRIVRQLLTESLVLALGAGVLGIGLAVIGLRVLVATAPQGVPRLEQAALDGPTLAFAAVAALASALLFGLLPAVKTARPDLTAALRAGGRGASGGSREWTKLALVSAEVAIALVLLIGAGLLIRTGINLGRLDPGFDPRGVLSARVTLPKQQYLEWDKVASTFTRMAVELEQAPGVQSAAVSSQVPLGPGGGSNGLIPEGRPLEGKNSIETRLRLITPGYLKTMRIALKAGREFTADDRLGTPRVTIVSENFAQIAFPGQNAIGKRVVCCEPGPDKGPAWKEIVGVAAEVRASGLDTEAPPEFYLPIMQAPPDAWDWIQRSVSLVVRGEGEPSALTVQIRAVMDRIDRSVPLYGISTMDERLSRSLAQQRFNTQLLVSLGVIGLVLAAIGIYGVIAYFVAQRTRELGIRMALGATPRHVLTLVVGEGLLPVAIGLIVGLGGALLATRAIASQLRGVGPNDPLTFAAVGGLLLLVAVGAMLVPARRATNVDALEAIREE
ncbi:MAG: ABC transporter permease [Gemmatimonadota bacterium]